MALHAEELIGDAASASDLSLKFDQFVDAINKAASTADGSLMLSTDGSGQVLTKQASPVATLERVLGTATLEKALGADQIASIQAALAGQQADIVKDLTLTSPLATGYVAYDLEAPAKMLTPRPTPLRNMLTRKKGLGTARKFKRITGFTGTGTGGVGNIRPGITDATTNTFGAKSLIRGPKISYAGDELSYPFLQFSLSDQVAWSAQYSGQGFMDYRAVSRASVLYASMLMEERLLLGGRGTASPFLGALAAPGSITLTARAAGAGETALSGVTTNVYAFVTCETIFGESVLSTVANVAWSAGQVVDVKVGTDVAGATGYRVYLGTGAAQPGNGAFWYAGRTGYNTFTAQGPLPTSGTAASSVTGDTSASALDYDGILTVCTGSSSGSVQRLNSAFSSANPGTEFQTAFAALWDAVKGDPDFALFNGNDRKQLSDLLKTASSSNYRLTISDDRTTGTHLGSLVTGIQNEVTGKMVDLEVHPWLAQGNVPIISKTLPIPDTEVDECFAVVNVQDYMAVDWPVDQFAFETSSYWYGTLVAYAPAWQAALTGIKKV